MGDPFKFIDDLLNGIVQFVFSVIFSIMTLLHAPLRGVIRLAVRYRRADTRQASFTALLFVLNALSYIFLDIAFAYPVFARGRYEALYSVLGRHILEGIQGPDTTRVLLYATTATALQSWWVALVARESGGKPGLEITTLKLGYTYFLFALVLVLVEASPVAAGYVAGWLTDPLRLRDIGLLAIELVPFLCGLALMVWGLYRARVLMPREGRAMLLYGMLPAMVAIQLGSGLVVKLFDAAERPVIDILTVACVVTDRTESNTVSLDATVMNNTDRVLVARPSDIVILGRPGARTRILKDDNPITYGSDGLLWLIPDLPASSFVVLEPRKPTRLSVHSSAWPGGPEFWGNATCGVSLTAASSYTADEHGREPVREEYRARAFALR